LSVYRSGSTELARLYEKALVLVRPDGHVAWRSDGAPDDAAEILRWVSGWKMTDAGRPPAASGKERASVN
jgi:hypothetical protein